MPDHHETLAINHTSCPQHPFRHHPPPPPPLQVRCMAAVLLMVGRGEEQPEVVQMLLDTQRCPRKPQFNMASGGLIESPFDLHLLDEWHTSCAGG